MKIAMTATVEWKEGAVLKLKQLTKEQKKEIADAVEKTFVTSLSDAKLEEVAKKELAEKREELKITPDQEGKERIEKEITVLASIANRTNNKLATKIGIAAMAATICGWEGVVNEETGEPIEFNVDTQSIIADSAFEDSKVVDKVLTFIRGPLGNSKAGLTSQLSTDGTPATVVNASETATK